MQGGVQAEEMDPAGAAARFAQRTVWEPFTGLAVRSRLPTDQPSGRRLLRGGEPGSPLCVRVRCPLSPEHGMALLNRRLLAFRGDAYLPGMVYICQHT